MLQEGTCFGTHFQKLRVGKIDSESLRKILFSLIFFGGEGLINSLEIVTGQVAGVSRFSRETWTIHSLPGRCHFLLHTSIKCHGMAGKKNTCF